MSEPPFDPKYTDPDQASKIYFLPNLATALNLFCGFLSVIRCIQAKFVDNALGKPPEELYAEAVWFILAAVFFDTLDGRLARLGGRESLFGKEFDSIADVVSFGMAPSLMVFFMILSDTQGYPFFSKIGWFIGFIYLLCVAIRLSRFNVITHPLMDANEANSSKDFVGLPAPAAAGMISSLVLVLNEYELAKFSPKLSLILPILMLLIAYLMVSSIRYPSMKHLDWSTRMKLQTFVMVLIVCSLLFFFREIGVTLLFLSYIFYGLWGHFKKRLSKNEKAEEINPEISTE